MRFGVQQNIRVRNGGSPGSGSWLKVQWGVPCGWSRPRVELGGVWAGDLGLPSPLFTQGAAKFRKAATGVPGQCRTAGRTMSDTAKEIPRYIDRDAHCAEFHTILMLMEETDWANQAKDRAPRRRTPKQNLVCDAPRLSSLAPAAPAGGRPSYKTIPRKRATDTNEQ